MKYLVSILIFMMLSFTTTEREEIALKQILYSPMYGGAMYEYRPTHSTRVDRILIFTDNGYLSRSKKLTLIIE